MFDIPRCLEIKSDSSGKHVSNDIMTIYFENI